MHGPASTVSDSPVEIVCECSNKRQSFMNGWTFMNALRCGVR